MLLPTSVPTLVAVLPPTDPPPLDAIVVRPPRKPPEVKPLVRSPLLMASRNERYLLVASAVTTNSPFESMAGMESLVALPGPVMRPPLAWPKMSVVGPLLLNRSVYVGFAIVPLSPQPPPVVEVSPKPLNDPVVLLPGTWYEPGEYVPDVLPTPPLGLKLLPAPPNDEP